MAAGDEELWPPPRLPELFEASQQLLDEVEAASEPTGSRTVQAKVLRGLQLLQRAADMLAQLDLFGPHEALEEMASADLQYLALPALQGALAMKQVGPAPRREHLQRARAHFLDYLARCRAHRVADFELPRPRPRPGAALADPGLLALASQRQAKIERYRLREELQARLSALKAAVQSGQADDELVREYHVLRLRRWIGISLEEIEGIDQELRILRGDDAAAQEDPASPPPPPTRPRLKPFVLTRHLTQARVFGAGYPSLASMTVNEWYEQQQQRGFGARSHQGRGHVAEPQSESAGASRAPKEEEEEEEEEDKDEERTRCRAREWDDWKDTHPKGYGNRQNMG